MINLLSYLYGDISSEFTFLRFLNASMTKNFEFWQIMEIQIMNVMVLNLTNNSNYDDDDRYCKIKQLA